MLLEDYVVAMSAGVIVGAVVILGSLLSKYSKLVQDADRSTRLAKDVWDSVTSRFSVVDGRIIDLMAKTEVLSSRVNPSGRWNEQGTAMPAPNIPGRMDESGKPATIGVPVPHVGGEGTETEVRVLRLLLVGPKSSAEIKAEVGKSREHTARLMKGLFDRGLVVRNARNKPYVYEITDNGRSYVAS